MAFDPGHLERLQRHYPDWATPHVPSEVVERLRSELQSAVPGLPVHAEEPKRYIHVTVPTASTSDYSFAGWINTDTPDMSIRAVLPEPLEPGTFFWGRALEAWDYSSPEALVEDFVSTLVLVAGNLTRVREKKGLLLMGYELEARLSDGWRRVPGSAAFRWSNIRFPELPPGETWRSEPYAAAPPR